jgi:hypothetical protein
LPAVEKAREKGFKEGEQKKKNDQITNHSNRILFASQGLDEF